jgi:hypothetical protein
MCRIRHHLFCTSRKNTVMMIRKALPKALDSKVLIHFTIQHVMITRRNGSKDVGRLLRTGQRILVTG